MTIERNTALLQINWQTRAVPLTACAVVARDEVARVLARRLLAQNDEKLATLSGIAGENVLIVLGESEVLPWADGALYLGRDAQTSSLLLPTTLAPAAPLLLLESALRSRFAHLPLPLAVLPQWNLVLPCGAAQSVARRELEKFVEFES